MSRSARRRLSTATGAQHKSGWALRACAVGNRLAGLAARHSRLVGLGVILCVAGVGAAGSGAVAAAIAAVYALIGVRLLQARATAAQQAADRTAAVEEIGELVAALRAGLPVPKQPGSRLVDQRASTRSEAALRISERLGAPLAELLDRVERDLRAQQRLVGTVTAELAGTRATIGLLTALPVAGVGIGYAIGADPVHQLFHTRLGIGCTAVALFLQTTGLAFSWYVTSAATKDLS